MLLKNLLILAAAAGITAPVVANPIEKRDGCHKKNDKIGKYCAFQTQGAWNSSVDLFCNQYPYGIPVPQGGSYDLKMDNMPDGADGQQIFWGNWRVDRGGDLMITQDMCVNDMATIYSNCGGYGGWINTAWGTVFGECIRE